MIDFIQMFSHSPKAFIYLHDVDFEGRPFLYMIGSHKDYEARNNLEKLPTIYL